MQKKILVVLTPTGKEFKSVHYALSLAERLEAEVYILQRTTAADWESAKTDWLQNVFTDLINSARQAGLSISHHISSGKLKEDIVNLFKGETVDVLVLNEDDKNSKQLLKEIKPLATSQIIQVKEKDQFNYL